MGPLFFFEGGKRRILLFDFVRSFVRLNVENQEEATV